MSRVEPNRNVYVGHRYVPLIVGEWDKSIQYEGLSIVTFEGASYTSKKMTPPGIDIENEEYWVLTGNYDAQVEYYRLETERVSNDLAQAKIDLNQRIDDTVEYVDTNVENLTIYVNDEIMETKEYVDGEVADLTEYVNDEIMETKEYVDGEVVDLKNHVNTNVTELNETMDSKVSKGELVLNIKDFGAVGDGVTNDTSSIQDCLNSSVNSKSKVFFPPGHYIINGDINGDGIDKYGLKVPSDTEIIMSEQCVIEITPTSSTSYAVFGLDNIENVTIKGGTLIGDKHNHEYQNEDLEEWGHGIRIFDSSNIEIENINIYDMLGDGIYIKNDFYYENILIDNVKIYNCRRHELTIIRGHNITIKNSYFTKSSNVTDGIINTEYGGTNIDMENNSNYVKGNIENILIKNNIFYCKTNTSILKHYATLDRYITIKENTFNKGSISFANSENVKIEKNLLKNNTENNLEYSAIRVRESSEVDVSDNTIEKTVTNGIWLDEVVHGSVTGNNVANADYAGILIQQSVSLKTSNNRVKLSGKSTQNIYNSGISLYDSEKCIIDSNFIYDLINTGITSSGSKNSKISNNLFSGVAGRNIEIRENSIDNTIKNNTFTITSIEEISSILRCIGSDNNKVINNSFTVSDHSSVAVGIQAVSSNDLTIYGNDLYTNIENAIQIQSTSSALSHSNINEIGDII